jgi:chemotaxis protein methyltransferase CheR
VPDAERSLRNVAKLVDRDGYLVVSGIDLDVRARVALDLGWTPVRELMEEVHEGDPSVRGDWPTEYWGLEPLDKTKPDWQIRYATVFRPAPPAA